MPLSGRLRFCDEMDFPAEKVDAVVEAIRTHQPAAHPTTIEGIILRDADILEQLGAIGILRTVCKIGRDTRFPTFTAAAESLRKALRLFLHRFVSRLDSRAGEFREIQVLDAFLRELEEESQPGVVLKPLFENASSRAIRALHGERIEVCRAIEVIDSFGTLEKIDHQVSQRRRQHLIRDLEKITRHNQPEHDADAAVPRR